jgi:hypothetical protein
MAEGILRDRENMCYSFLLKEMQVYTKVISYNPNFSHHWAGKLL